MTNITLCDRLKVQAQEDHILPFECGLIRTSTRMSWTSRSFLQTAPSFSSGRSTGVMWLEISNLLIQSGSSGSVPSSTVRRPVKNRYYRICF